MVPPVMVISVATSHYALPEFIFGLFKDRGGVMPDISSRPASDAGLMNAFLLTLTDPCVLDRACVAPWIPDPSDAPDEHQLNAVDAQGNAL